MSAAPCLGTRDPLAAGLPPCANARGVQGPPHVCRRPLGPSHVRPTAESPGPRSPLRASSFPRDTSRVRRGRRCSPCGGGGTEGTRRWDPATHAERLSRRPAEFTGSLYLLFWPDSLGDCGEQWAGSSRTWPLSPFVDPARQGRGRGRWPWSARDRADQCPPLPISPKLGQAAQRSVVVTLISLGR